jgi:hypothetical protein
LYERIVDEFVSSWFRHISPDEEFVQEIRILLRDITQDLLTRLAKVGGAEYAISTLLIA